MTRGATSAFDLQTFAGGSVNLPPHGWPGGLSAPTTDPVADTTTKRSGAASAKCVGGASATSYLTLPGISSSSGALNDYRRVWVYLNAYPTATKRIVAACSGTQTYAGSVRLTSGGALQLWNAAATPAQIGSDSAQVPLNEWFCVMLGLRSSGTAANCWIEARWGREGETPATFASQSGSFISSGAVDSGTWTQLGWLDAPGQAATIWFADAAQNVNSGAYENTWPAPSAHIVVMPPKRLVSRGTWTTDKSTTTEADFLTALGGGASLAPAGTTDGTAAATPHQIRSVAAASTGSPDYCEMECWSYGRAGGPGPAFVEAAGGTYQALGDAAARTRVAQGFYLANGLTRVELNIRSQGSPSDDLTVDVQADSAGAPSGTSLGSATIPAAALTGTAAWVAVDLTVPLTPRAKYWLVLARAGAVDASNYYQFQKSTANAYYDGGVALHNGSAWGAATLADALMFRLVNDVGAAKLTVLARLACHGEGASTGTKTAVVEITNPGGATAYSIAAVGGDLGACGAYITNWFWVGPTSVSAPALGVPSMADSPRVRFGKTDSGTRAVDVCWLGVIVEYTDPPGWAQFTKTADSTLWWAKPVATDTTAYYDNSGTETALSCRAGDWLITADPLPAEGVMLTSLATTTDADIKANYTPV